MKKLLLVVAMIQGTATNLARLAMLNSGIEARALCPPNGLSGLLDSLRKNFVNVHSVIITVDAFENISTLDAIKQIHEVKPSLRIYVVRTGGMKSFTEKELKGAGASGAYSISILKNNEFADWVNRSLKKESDSFFMERIKKPKKTAENHLEVGDGDDSGDDDIPPEGDSHQRPVQAISTAEPLANKRCGPGVNSSIHGKPFLKQAKGTHTPELPVSLDKKVDNLLSLVGVSTTRKDTGKPKTSPDHVPIPSTPSIPIAKTPVIENVSSVKTETVSEPTHQHQEQQTSNRKEECPVSEKSFDNSSHVFLLALADGAEAFASSIRKQLLCAQVVTKQEEPARATESGNTPEIKPCVKIEPINKIKSRVSFDGYEFIIHPNYAKLFELLVLADGKILSMYDMMKIFDFKKLTAVNSLIHQTVKQIKKISPKVGECIKNKKGTGYYFAKPST